jgi:hypothetical protein
MDKRHLTRVERLLSLLALGVAAALKEKIIHIDEAEPLLFSPASMRALEGIGADKRLIALIHDGTELEDIESLLAPGELAAAIEAIRTSAKSFLSATPPTDSQLDHWVTRLLQ